jgi:hypothetical protein
VVQEGKGCAKVLITAPRVSVATAVVVAEQLPVAALMMDRTEGGGNEDVPTKLKQLKEMLDRGIVTQEEFDNKKTELLARM